MDILLVTSAPPGSEFGSETTSIRWENNLSALGHRVDTSYVFGKSPDTYATTDYELMVAIGAEECDEAITAFLATHADGHLAVMLTGHNLYAQPEVSPIVARNIERASAIIVPNDHAVERLPPQFRDKTHVLYPAVELPEGGVEAIPDPPLREERQTDPPQFEVCVANHLADYSDPLRTAEAARLLPEDSRIFVTHIGRVLDPQWEARVEGESETNPRYDWLGEASWSEARRYIKRARLLSLTSTIDGGGNTIAEAVVLGTPLVATRIPGHVGLTGEDYPGLLETHDERTLAEMMYAVETDPDFREQLDQECARMRPKFDMNSEREGWRKILDSIQQA